MTKEEFYKRFNEMKELADKEVNKRAAHLLNSGAIDLVGKEDNYLLPKMVLAACFENVAWQFHPLSEEGKEELANLRKF